jgi:hypothetical protein
MLYWQGSTDSAMEKTNIGSHLCHMLFVVISTGVSFKAIAVKKENFKFTPFLVKFTPFLRVSDYMQIKFECVCPHPPDV